MSMFMIKQAEVLSYTPDTCKSKKIVWSIVTHLEDGREFLMQLGGVLVKKKFLLTGYWLFVV